MLKKPARDARERVKESTEKENHRDTENTEDHREELFFLGKGKIKSNRVSCRDTARPTGHRSFGRACRVPTSVS